MTAVVIPEPLEKPVEAVEKVDIELDNKTPVHETSGEAADDHETSGEAADDHETSKEATGDEKKVTVLGLV